MAMMMVRKGRVSMITSTMIMIIMLVMVKMKMTMTMMVILPLLPTRRVARPARFEPYLLLEPYDSNNTRGLEAIQIIQYVQGDSTSSRKQSERP